MKYAFALLGMAVLCTGCDMEPRQQGKTARQWAAVLERSRDPAVRDLAVRELFTLKLTAVAPLMEALHNRDPDVRRRAVLALARLGPVAWQAVPALAKALRDPDVEVRRRAALALERMSPADKEAVSALAAARRDPDEIVRERAARALASYHRLQPGAKLAGPAG